MSGSVYLVQYAPPPERGEAWEDDDVLTTYGFTETQVAGDEFSARAIAAQYRGRIGQINRMLGHDDLEWEEAPLTEFGGVKGDEEPVVIWLSSKGHMLRLCPTPVETHAPEF